MGSCLSKSGKKGKSDDVDKVPYGAPVVRSSPAMLRDSPPPARRSPPVPTDKSQSAQDIPLRENIQRKTEAPGPAERVSQRHPTKPETVKPSLKQDQPTVSKAFKFSICVNTSLHMFCLASQNFVYP